MRKHHNRHFILVSASLCLCLYLVSTVSAMQIGGFDIDVANGENSSWQWQEEEQWNQSSWESNWESNWGNTWENTWQNDDNDTSEIPAQNSQMQNNQAQNDQGQDNGYQYNTDMGNKAQDHTQWWEDNTQQNYSHDDFSQNNQYQTDDNIQTTSRAENEATVEIPERISTTSDPMPASTMTSTPKPTQTPKPTKTPRQTKTPKPTRPPTPETVKKKNKKKQNKINKTEKNNKNTDNSGESQGGENQPDIVKYIHAKDESVEFQCTQNPDNFHIPQIQIISKGSVQVLSFRLNGIECPWHWKEDRVVSDIAVNHNVGKIELLVISQGGKLIKMDPWIFSS